MTMKKSTLFGQSEDRRGLISEISVEGKTKQNWKIKAKTEPR